MTGRSRWTTADFDELSWHDCHVHAFRLHDPGEFGVADVDFDIDFIVEWLCPTDGPFQFRVAPATLTFHQAFGLRFELDYEAVGAGMTPFSLDGIERETPVEAPGSPTWQLRVNWPKGSITFASPGFTLQLRREPILIGRQRLTALERESHG
jgi:hypothetical protein